MIDSGKISSIRNIVERNSKTIEVQQRVLVAAEQGEVVDFKDFCYLCTVEGGEYIAPVASLALETVLPAAENVDVDYHCRGRFEYGTHRAEIFEWDGAPCIRILPNDKAVSSLCLGVGQFEYLLDVVAKYGILRERFGVSPSKADCRKHGYEICSMMNSKGAERMSRQKNGKKLLAKSATHTMRNMRQCTRSLDFAIEEVDEYLSVLENVENSHATLNEMCGLLEAAGYPFEVADAVQPAFTYEKVAELRCALVKAKNSACAKDAAAMTEEDAAEFSWE